MAARAFRRSSLNGYTRSAARPAATALSDDSATTQFTVFSEGPRRPGPRSACVVVIHGNGLGRRVDLGSRPVLIGRADDSDLVIAHKSVSRSHCRLWLDDGHYRIRDLGATNRTRVNDAPVEESVLADGDHIVVGESILKFIAQTSVEAGYHQEIYQLATHDALSGLYNRRHFSETLDHEIARAHRHGHVLSLCIIDVDLFKSINDTFGHLVGDDVLRRIAGVIRGHVHGGDLAARIGGEEFAVLLPESDLAAAVAFADRLRAAVAATGFDACGAPRPITISIGVAALATPAADGPSLMAAADAALYHAKETGRDRVCSAP